MFECCVFMGRALMAELSLALTFPRWCLSPLLVAVPVEISPTAKYCYPCNNVAPRLPELVDGRKPSENLISFRFDSDDLARTSMRKHRDLVSRQSRRCPPVEKHPHFL